VVLGHYRCADLVSCRIEGVFDDMLRIKLCEIDGEEPVAIADFLSTTEELCGRGSEALQIRSRNVEEAVEELIALVYPEYNVPVDQEEEVAEGQAANLQAATKDG
jgi:hypothetical protein